jgi:hypothetical protein
VGGEAAVAARQLIGNAVSPCNPSEEGAQQHAPTKVSHGQMMPSWSLHRIFCTRQRRP